MGVRTHDRSVNEPKQVIPPKPIDVNDGGYRGAHPDAINYPNQETISDGKRSLELKSFTAKGMEQLRRIAEEQLLPLLESENLDCAVLAEKRRDSGTGRTVLGVCWGKKAQQHGMRTAIMLRRPNADDPRVAYTTLHETAHLTQDSHGAPFRARFSELLLWAVGDGTPFSEWRRELVGFAKGDTYAPPTPPAGGWDDYATRTAQPSYEVNFDEELTGFFEEAAPLPAAALTVDASYGVKDWGFTDDLVPKRDAQSITAEVDLQELVERYIDQDPSVLEELPNGGFSWNTKQMGWGALAPLYAERLAAQGVGKRRIQKLLQVLDYRAVIRNNSDAIQPVLDAEVRRRRATTGEVN